MNRCILHIDLDAFFVSVEQALAPELRGKPVIVGGRPDRRGVVASASYEARAFGIRAAMPLSKAYRLCPQATFLHGNFQLYRDFSSKFMGTLADFSPFLEPGGLDEAYLDVTGCEIHGSPLEIAVKIKERVKKELNLVASIGIAGCKIVAKVASDLSKPNGLLEIATGEEKGFLSPLHVERLPGVGEKTAQELRKMGITTIGQLAALPVDTMKSHFGVYGVILHKHANGIDDRKVEPYDEVKSISRETTFEQDTLEQRFLEAMLRHLSERVGADLRSQDKRARTVSLKLRYADFETITRRLTSREAIASDEAIFSGVARLLNQTLTKKRKLVRLLGVGVSNLVSDTKQLHLLNSESQRWEHLNRTIDRIREKYGFTSIQTGRTFTLKDVFANEEFD